MQQENRYSVRLSEVGEGTMHACVVGGREIVICHAKGALYALDNICSHAHARLSEGRLRGTRLICPLHGAAFDVRDGRPLGPPAIQGLCTYPVQVVEANIEVTLPTPVNASPR